MILPQVLRPRGIDRASSFSYYLLSRLHYKDKNKRLIRPDSKLLFSFDASYLETASSRLDRDASDALRTNRLRRCHENERD
jgi:hypothetical protein